MPFVFSHVECCDMHFVYGFCNGNARAVVEEYQGRFPDRRIPSRSVFTRIHHTLHDTGSLASFTRDGVNNLRNVHMWSHDNPHETSVTNFQRRFSVNVRCGVLGNKLIGPFVFDNNLTGNAYEAFLWNELPGLLEDIPLMTRSCYSIPLNACRKLNCSWWRTL